MIADDRFRALSNALVMALEYCQTADELEYAIRAECPNATEDEWRQVFETYGELMDVQTRMALRAKVFPGRPN